MILEILLTDICTSKIQYQHPFQYQDNKLDIVPALNFLPHFIIQNGKRHDNRSTLFLSSICSCLNTKIRKKEKQGFGMKRE